MKHVYTRLIVVTLVLASYTSFSQNVKQIRLFDLSYTLTSDFNDQQNLKTSWEDVHLVSSLQGIVNRDSPRLYTFFVANGDINIDRYWWNMYRRPGKWLHGADTIVYTDIVSLVSAFKSEINGAVVYDPNVAATSNVASSVSGVENLVAIRYDTAANSLYSRLILGGPKLPVKSWLVNKDGSVLFKGNGLIPGTKRTSSGSAKNDAYLWFLEKYIKTNKVNTGYGAYYIDQDWLKKPFAAGRNHHTLTNHDFFISKKGFFFDLSPWADEAATDDLSQKIGTDNNTLKEILLEAYKKRKCLGFAYLGGFPPWAFKYTQHAGGKHDDVPTEWEYSRIISAYNAFKDADAIGYGALANASFWQHFPLKEKYPQTRVTTTDLKARGYLTDDGKVDFKGRQFMIFYVGDYDASSWVSQMTPFLWDSKDRGKLPLMWSISPVLEERVPMALDYIRSSASSNDYFASADNGAGYLMPGMLQSPRPISGLPDAVDDWATHNMPYYKRWDITITGFVIDGLAPGLNQNGLDAYAKFSPNGIIPQKTPLTLLHGNMPVLRADADINQGDPKEAADAIIDRVSKRNLQFHWFRNILKSPSWYVEVMAQLKQKNPNIELLDAPTFFELYRIWLKQNPAAANGKIN
ncbi:GxGYxYP domain-containing protein [Pedobacter sp. PWIIR3]